MFVWTQNISLYVHLECLKCRHFWSGDLFIYKIFAKQKQHMAELKLVWLVIMTGDDRKNISSPACVTWMKTTSSLDEETCLALPIAWPTTFKVMGYCQIITFSNYLYLSNTEWSWVRKRKTPKNCLVLCTNTNTIYATKYVELILLSHLKQKGWVDFTV